MSRYHLFCFSPRHRASARFVINSEVGCDIMHCNDGGWMQIIDIHSSSLACSEPHPKTPGPLLRYSSRGKEVLFTTNNGRKENESLQWSHTSVHTHISVVVVVVVVMEVVVVAVMIIVKRLLPPKGS